MNDANTTETSCNSTDESLTRSHQEVAYEIIALLAERRAKMKDTRLILRYTKDLWAFTPIVRLSLPR
jgi:hypothetical protein